MSKGERSVAALAAGISCVADHIQHHKFSNNRPSWFLRHRGRSSGRGSSARERRGALYRGTEVQTVALVRGRCSGSVGREQHLLAGVLTALTGFGQCAGYMINSGGISY